MDSIEYVMFILGQFKCGTNELCGDVSAAVAAAIGPWIFSLSLALSVFDFFVVFMRQHIFALQSDIALKRLGILC